MSITLCVVLRSISLSVSKEMLEYMGHVVGNPGEYWNYRDESFVGFWATASSRRGGANKVATTVLNFLNRFRALDRLG